MYQYKSIINYNSIIIKRVGQTLSGFPSRKGWNPLNSIQEMTYDPLKSVKEKKNPVVYGLFSGTVHYTNNITAFVPPW